MKLLTHNIVGLGVTALTSSLLGCSIACVLSSSLLGVISQNIIDTFSHEHRGRYSRRTRLLHSVEGVTGLTLILSSLIAVVLKLGGWDIIGLLIAVEASTLSHLLLDSITPDGIYILGKKFSLARIPYDSPEANVAAQALGLIALATALLSHLP